MRESERAVSRALPGCLALLIPLTIVTGAVDMALLWNTLKQPQMWPGTILAHTAVAMTWIFSLPICRRYNQDRRLPWIGALAVFFLGPMGAVGMLLGLLSYTFLIHRSTPFELWYRNIVPDRTSPPEEQLLERLRAWSDETHIGHYEPVPFLDILAIGTRSDKQAVIALIARHYDPQFSPVLHSALNDPDSAIRVQAASVIASIEDYFMMQSLVLERELERQPNDIETLWELASHYDAHSCTGLCDSDTQATHRQYAERAYRRLIDLDPDNSRSRWALGRLLVRSGQPGEAASIFEQSIALPDAPKFKLQRFWYWECLYCLKRYEDLRRELSEHAPKIRTTTALPPTLLDAIELWTRGGHAEATTP